MKYIKNAGKELTPCEDPCRNQNPYSAMIEATLLHKSSIEDFF